jgi:hypothetical protein
MMNDMKILLTEVVTDFRAIRALVYLLEKTPR